MAISSKRSIGMRVGGFLFVIAGVVLAITANPGVGIILGMVGGVLIANGVAAARKAASTSDSAGTSAPTSGGSGRPEPDKVPGRVEG